MTKPDFTKMESDRLQELYSYNILDSEIDKDFEELVDFASQLSGCAIAAISFIDKDRQWFKAKKGDTLKETPREISFCAHAILTDEPLVVEDAIKDERFKHNPDVTGGLGIRFYAGIPIYSRNKFKLGTVCVIDNKPRKNDDKLVTALKLISKEVSNLLELRFRNKLLEAYSLETLEDSVNNHQLFFEKAALPCWIYELETLAFLQVNEAAIKKYGYSREEFLKMTVYDIREKNEKLKIHQLVQGSNGSGGAITFPSIHCTKSKEIMYVEVTVRDIVYLGKAARMATINDVTAKEKFKKLAEEQESSIQEAMRSAQLQERDFIGKELHDNINQILASTKLYLEIASTNENMRETMIKRSRNNVLEAINEIRRLSHSLIGDKKLRFNFEEAVQQTVYPLSAANIRTHVKIDSSVDELPEDLQLTLFRIVQEAITNISKHAKATEVRILVEIRGSVSLIIKDNGKGFDPVDTWQGIGLSNMKQRAGFYNGRAEITSAPNKGCSIKIFLPLQFQQMAV